MSSKMRGHPEEDARSVLTKEARKKTVLVHLGAWSKSRERFSGVCRFGREHNWTIHLVEDIASNVRYSWCAAIAYWKPDGLIVDGDDVPVPKRYKPVTVHCDADPSRMRGRYYGVCYDSIGSAEKVMNELTELNYPHYGFVGYYTRIGWSQARQAYFRERLGERFESALVLDDGDGDAVAHLKRIREWLAMLPRPCAIFAVNDAIARNVAILAQGMGIVIPDGLAIASIDNDEALCEGVRPTLTSVTQNFEESGYRAAEMLDRLMCGEPLEPPVRLLSETILTRRESTRLLKAGGIRVAAALEYLRRHAGEGIGVSEVVRFLGCSRRKAEGLFREYANRSILEEILDARFDRACVLLKIAHFPLDAIYQQCGYQDDTAFRRFFKSRAGVPLGEWRKLHS